MNPFYKVDILSYQTDEENKISSEIRIGPLRKGIGLTLGNALRRSVFINLEGVAITGLYLYNMVQNFGTVDALREDIFELSLNLQNVVLKSEKIPISCEGKISKRGPCIITAEDILLPAGVSVINPYQYIGCVNENYSADIILDIRSGRGYNILDSETQKSIEQTREEYFKFRDNEKRQTDIYSTSSETSKTLTSEYQVKYDLDYMKVDSIFTPIQSFSFQVEVESMGDVDINTNTTIAEQNEYLHIYLTTNGSITPYQAIEKATKELINLLLPLQNFDNRYNENPLIDESSKVKSKKKENNTFSDFNSQIDKKDSEFLKLENSQLIEPQTQEFTNYPLEKLKISKRILNSLKRANYTKIGDLLESSQTSLKNMKNFGKKSFEELKFALNELGISLDDDKFLS